MTSRPLLLFCLCGALVASLGAQDLPVIRPVAASLVAEDGLYFTGERGVGYQFGRRITPHGDCIDVLNGYLFVTWYRGGMDQRRLMLSRRKADDPTAAWVTLPFPHRHIGYQGDTTKGDSHNTAAIAISPLDSTIHLIYDLHAYRASSFPDDFFNYSVSRPGTAFLPDEAFTPAIFPPKRKFLNPAFNYERTTYPAIRRAPDGSLIARYRIGGSGNGDLNYASYRDGAWSGHQTYADGTLPLPERYSLYGGEAFHDGRLHACFSIRYASGSSYNDRFNLNRGLFWAYAEPPFGPGDWYTTDGKPLALPFGHPDDLLVGTPSLTYGTADRPRTSTSPLFTVTDQGAMHAIVRVDNINTHYWKAPRDSVFSSAAGGDILSASGFLFAYRGYVIAVDRSGDRLLFRATPEGRNEWTTILRETTGPEYRHFNGKVVGDRLYLYLMEEGSGDAQPLVVRTFELSGGATATRAPVRRQPPFCFPNPSDGQLHLTRDLSKHTYLLTTLDGRRVATGTIHGQTLSLAPRPAGVYLLSVRTPGGWLRQRLVLR